ncbi:Hypothetical predicted protein [Scomber scombrus]|uniref:Uncharacterized protein n=1 Tax=Scomber scombrus TaxID=13677 RepID=A0AAV1PZF4_SCOSC
MTDEGLSPELLLAMQQKCDCSICGSRLGDISTSSIGQLLPLRLLHLLSLLPRGICFCSEVRHSKISLRNCQLDHDETHHSIPHHAHQEDQQVRHDEDGCCGRLMQQGGSRLDLTWNDVKLWSFSTTDSDRSRAQSCSGSETQYVNQVPRYSCHAFHVGLLLHFLNI